MNRAGPPPGGGLRARLVERTADLQRLKAEYDNYRKRVHRDRLAAREVAVAEALDTAPCTGPAPTPSAPPAGGRHGVLSAPPSTSQLEPIALGIVGDARSSTARAISAGSINAPVTIPACWGSIANRVSWSSCR